MAKDQRNKTGRLMIDFEQACAAVCSGCAKRL